MEYVGNHGTTVVRNPETTRGEGKRGLAGDPAAANAMGGLLGDAEAVSGRGAQSASPHIPRSSAPPSAPGDVEAKLPPGGPSWMHQHYERERQLIAFEIHDGLIQHITGARMHLETALGRASMDQASAQTEVRRASHLLAHALGEARALIQGLRPPVLDEWGVVAAINCLIEEHLAEGPQVEFVHRMPLERLEPLLESTIFRIAQEALTNVKRHSQSDRALIRLVHSEARIDLEIRDWGVGFDPDCVGRSRFGLAGIRERARLLNGRALIESTPGWGARILVELPVARAPCRRELVHAKDRSSE